jgi:hypothetical protein
MILSRCVLASSRVEFPQVVIELAVLWFRRPAVFRPTITTMIAVAAIILEDTCILSHSFRPMKGTQMYLDDFIITPSVLVEVTLD